MKWAVIFIVALAVRPALSQYGWQKVDTLTGGEFDDLHPQVTCGEYTVLPYGTASDLWVLFERWNAGLSSIAGVRNQGQNGSWDTTVYTISPATIGVTQRLPHICSLAYWVLAGNDYEQKSFSIAAWQEKSDSVWNIYYSTCGPDTQLWSAPVALTSDSVSNENPIVRSLNDSTLIVLWERDSSVYYSIFSGTVPTRSRFLVNTGADSSEFDFFHYDYRQFTGVAWTATNRDGKKICLVGTIGYPDSMGMTTVDTIVLNGDIDRPRFRQMFATLLTFDLSTAGRKEAWMSELSGTWQSDVVAGDSLSDNFGLAFFSPPELVTEAGLGKKMSIIAPWGFGLWERTTGEDTSLVFLNSDTVSSPGSNSDPEMSTYARVENYSNIRGFAVFQSSRTGRSHIYSRSYLYFLGAVEMPRHPVSSFDLRQNYPNPFNPATTISYRLSAVSQVNLKVYDVLGRLVRSLVNERQSPGEHSAIFDARSLASGIYFFRLEVSPLSSSPGMAVSTRKALLLK
ncbi:MAG TPA: T9SS type A sorting domain-containing protein [Candidatus Kryptonia bacterium]